MIASPTIKSAVLGVAGIVVVATGPFVTAEAQEPKITRAEGRAIFNACRTDIERYCSHVTRGEGRIAACMRENGEKLSADCRNTLKEVFAK